jgi:hypothetical protein
MADEITRVDDSAVAVSDAAVVETAPETRKHPDKELELYRSLLTPPKEYKNGFTWTVVAGAIFCGLLMMPGSIYLSLITGGQINAAMVTLIIFSEVSRRALKTLNTQELVVLLQVAGAMSLGGPFADLIYRQYFVNSDAVRDVGLLGKFPTWWAPPAGSSAFAERMLIHHDWLIPIALIGLMTVIYKVNSYALGYFFFRVTSDVEKLPFPFAPISAQGAMALAESGERKSSMKWNIFSVGAIIGLIFATLQIGVPMITGTFLAKPIYPIPMPWMDTTTLTERFMPATPTGAVIDAGLLISGMIMPFWSVIGTMSAILLTFFLNPILQHAGILSQWRPGMDTINTQYVNYQDFWLSFSIGVMGSLAIISIYQCLRDLSKQLIELRKQQKATASETARRENIWAVPPGRGDFSLGLALGLYAISATLLMVVSHTLVPQFPLWILGAFVFIYTPFVTYLNARLIAINGQQVNIPMLREGAFILSGYKGVNIWLAPIPVVDYGSMAQTFRVIELTGTTFTSFIKADMLVVPLSFILSFVFWAFVWHSAAIPSEAFPWVEKMWSLQAKQTILWWSSTLPNSGNMFMKAIHPGVIGSGFAFTSVAFMLLSLFKLPTMSVYGFILGVGQLPHSLIFLVIGAFVGRFYFQKRYGQTNFLQMAPIVLAGYMCGVGLIALIGVAVTLITKAISAAPF